MNDICFFKLFTDTEMMARRRLKKYNETYMLYATNIMKACTVFG